MNYKQGFCVSGVTVHKCVEFTGHLWWGLAQIYAFPCVHVFTDSSLAWNEIGDAPRYACPCVIPVQNAEREAPSCVAGAACQCCPSGTDTHGASGLLNRLPGWAGSHTSGERDRKREGERGEEQKGVEEKKAGNYASTVKEMKKQCLPMLGEWKTVGARENERELQRNEQKV